MGRWAFTDTCSGDVVVNIAPTAELTSPVASADVTEGDTVALTATASDSDGSVARVEFLVDGAVVAQTTKAPYSASWTAVSGSHTFSSIAYDNEGEKSTQSSVTVDVKASPTDDNQAPSVSVALSANSVDIGAVVTLTADAADSDGTVDKVDFYVAGSLVGSVASAPYTLDYTTTKAGTLAIFAKATDNEGVTTNSSTASLKVLSDVPTTSTCHPDGLYQTEGVDVPYCDAYDADGREIMGADHPRRVIGYFTSWRSGDDPQAAYLVKDIPWEQLSHINYAFVSIGSDGNVNIGDVNDPNNAAVNKTWPGWMLILS